MLHSSHPQLLSVRTENLNRRRFLSLFGLAGVATVLTPLAYASLPPLSGAALPTEWFRMLGSSLNDYLAFVGKLKLRFVPMVKFIEPHLKQHGSVRNSLPPADLWANMTPTLLVADKLAERLGENVHEVISAYRSPAYNATCPGGKTKSQHLRNGAVDLVFKSSPSTVGKVAREMRAEGVFRGGVGVYPDFTHIDTRGTNADW